MTSYIEQHLIEPNPYQPRLEMDPVALNRLADFAHQCKVKLPAGWDSRLTGLSAPVAKPAAGKPKRK